MLYENDDLVMRGYENYDVANDKENYDDRIVVLNVIPRNFNSPIAAGGSEDWKT